MSDRRRTLPAAVRGVEEAFLSFVERYSLPFLRYSLAVVLVWFGTLTATGVGETANLVVTALGIPPTGHSLIVLGGWEVASGLALLYRRTIRLAAVLVAIYVAVTLIPLVAFPSETFAHFPYAPSFEGVYIIKNWVLLGGVMTIGGAIDDTIG